MPGPLASELGEANADGEGLVHERHGGRVKRTKSPSEPALVEGADLVEENDRVGLEATLRSFDENLGWVEVRVVLRGYSG
jgi:hypothetical protein